MNRPDVDDVIKYLSTKFKKIYCDRDFVCCVIEDFQTILDNKDRTCVLVFPTLGPTYLKALRYQARIFDLAVFNITSASGKFRSIAVCHKDHLKKTSQPKEENMSESSSSSSSSTLSKRKRPERQLYVPPAQRSSRLTTKCDKKVTQEAVKNSQHDCQKNLKNRDLHLESKNQCSSEKCVLLTLSDFVNLFHYFSPFLCDFKKWQESRYQHQNCEFKKFLNFKKIDNSLKYNNFIKIYDTFPVLSNICYRLSNFISFTQKPSEGSKSYPIFDFSDVLNLPEKPAAVLVNNEVSDFEKSIIGIQEVESSVYRIECDKPCDESESCILDLSVLDLGHFFIISIEEECYFYECQENHDATSCYINRKRELEAAIKIKKLNVSAIMKNENEQTVINKNQRSEIDIDKNGTNESPMNKTENVKNKINVNKKKVSDNKHEQEKEIMRITKEYINRKTRPIMKYVDDSDDLLKIDKDDSVNNWEDLFDDNGQIQEELLTEIVDKVGDDITIVKANEDYTAYTNKPPEDLEHVVELYNFPASLETHDLVQAFSDINSDAMYIKWVDDTHALLVLGSLSQAQKAMNMGNPLIKVRPMTAASAMSVDVANKSDLKPAMKRPPTNLQTARRLITTHLGTKSKLSKEQIAKEKQDLKNAREMKRLIKQSEKDAWEGNIRSTIN